MPIKFMCHTPDVGRGLWAVHWRGEGATRVDALFDITMTVSSGEVVGLLGPSGSGKTTLLNAIGAIIEPNAGWMRLDGEVVYDNRWLRRDLRRLRLEKIGFIFQIHNLLPFLNATDNVAVVLQLAGVPRDEGIRRSVELFDYLAVGHRKRAMPSELSGGEAQRVAIARALANRPRIILADEPTAALDSARAGIVMDLLRTRHATPRITAHLSSNIFVTCATLGRRRRCLAETHLSRRTESESVVTLRSRFGRLITVVRA